MRLKFSNKEKLKSKKEIANIFKNNKTAIEYPFKLIYLKSCIVSTKNKYAIIIPKKKVKKAILRNRLKRLIFESLRKVKNNLSQNGYNIIIIYIGNVGEYKYSYVDTKVRKLLDKFKKNIC